MLLLLEELLLLCDVRGGVPVLVVGRRDVGKRRVRRVPRKLSRKHTVSLIARMYEKRRRLTCCCGIGGGWFCCTRLTSAMNFDVGGEAACPGFEPATSTPRASALTAAARRERAASGVRLAASDRDGEVAIDAPSSISSSISRSSDFFASPSRLRSASILAWTTCARLLTRPGVPPPGDDLNLSSKMLSAPPPKSGWLRGGFS